MTEWSAWSACTSSCGRGWMYMERSVLAQPGPGGRYNTELPLVNVLTILSCDWLQGVSPEADQAEAVRVHDVLSHVCHV